MASMHQHHDGPKGQALKKRKNEATRLKFQLPGYREAINIAGGVRRKARCRAAICALLAPYPHCDPYILRLSVPSYITQVLSLAKDSSAGGKHKRVRGTAIYNELQTKKTLALAQHHI